MRQGGGFQRVAWHCILQDVEFMLIRFKIEAFAIKWFCYVYIKNISSQAKVLSDKLPGLCSDVGNQFITQWTAQ